MAASAPRRENPTATAIEATITSTPSTASTPRQPRKSPIRPDSGTRPTNCRSWRRPRCARSRPGACPAPTRSLVRLSATGKTPPEPMPARIRLANSIGNEVAIAPRMLARPSSTRQNDHQPRLAEHVGGGAQHRLHDRKGEGEHCREACRGRDADAEIVGDMRQHRIERARRQAGRKGRERNDIEGRQECGWMRSPLPGGISAWRFWPARRTPSASSPGPRTRAAAPCWVRPRAHDPDRDGFR